MATSRPFAYNTGAAIDGTEQLGSLAIGTPTTGFTGSPKFYMGPDEDNGYVVAGPVSGGTQPSPVSGETASLQFWGTKVKTDNELINLARSISKFTQTFGSTSAAKTWLNNNGYWTSYGTGIVTSGLVLNLDAGNPDSYNGSGNTWYDLSGNGINATLIDSYLFPSSGITYDVLGGLTLDGPINAPAYAANDFFSLGKNTNLDFTGDLSIEVWVRQNSIFTNNATIFCNGYWTGESEYYKFQFQGGGGNNHPYSNLGLFRGDLQGNGGMVWWNFGSQTSYFVDKIVHLVGVFEGTNWKIYYNGVSQNLSIISAPNSNTYNVTNNTNKAIGAQYNLSSTQAVDEYPATFFQTRVYNRALSDAEVLQNYNAQKSRFGL